MNFTFRPYRPGDEHQINQGFEAVFKTTRSLAEWRWKFQAASQGAWILLAVDAQDFVVAQYAAIKRSIHFQGQFFDAGHVVDSYCRRIPQAVRQQVFPKLVLEFYRYFGDAGEFQLLFGFPGDRHQKLGQLRMDYSQPVPLQCWRKTIPLRQKLISSLNPLNYKPVQPVTDSAAFDRLWKQVMGRYPAATCRTMNWIQERYFSRPNHRYHLITSVRDNQLQAWAIVLVSSSVIQWIDLVWDGGSSAALRDLEQQVLNSTGISQKVNFELWLTGDAQLGDALSRLGWYQAPHPLGLHVTARWFGVQADPNDFTRQCYLTMGDTDLI